MLLPTFTALSDIRLLNACSGCKDQNANESLHSVIWSRVPKIQSHSPAEVSLGINMAVMLFNDGYRESMEALYQSANLSIAPLSFRVWDILDKTRVEKSMKRTQNPYKEQRRNKRQSKLKQLDAFKRKEGPTYQSNAFHVTSLGASSGKRKPPVCSICKQPRKGHRSRGCIIGKSKEQE